MINYLLINYLIDTHVAMIWSCNIYSWQGRIIIAKLSQQTTAAAVTTVRKMKNHIYTVTKQNGGRKKERTQRRLFVLDMMIIIEAY